MTEFTSLRLKPELLQTLDELGYHKMTMVQAQSLPRLLEGDDVLARARTGSGKTAAFALALLNDLDATKFRVQALVLCPTRELADQVTRETRRLARGIANVKILSLSGGVPLGPQIGSLQHSPHIVVGTPGRLLKHLKKGTLQLKHLKILVLDEADRMLDMGFTDEVDAILEYVPASRQTLLFSATYPPAIAEISSKVQREPVHIDVTDDDEPAQIAQFWFPVTQESRDADLVRALRAWGGTLNLVFCHTRADCAELATFLRARRIAALALHGDLDQAKRNEVLVRFSNRSASVLIATDVAARGLDIDDINAVFNYELPAQAEVYIHRIGRTGRAGKKGVAVSLVEQREMGRLRAIEELLPAASLHKREIADVSRPREVASSDPLVPTMTTIQVSGGRKNKLRPGDLLGALTAKGGVPGKAVGSIDLLDTCGYVAVAKAHAEKALRQLSSRPIKGRQFRARIRK